MTEKLTSENLRGIWAGITLSWDENYELDEAAFRENLRRLVEVRPHGIYIFGSTGEFHAVDDDEFRRVVDILIEEVSASGIPTQAGCNGLATRQIITKLKYAQAAGVDGGQVALPSWMKLTEEEIVSFWRDISEAVPQLPLISYNISRTKWYMYHEQYSQIMEVAPNLIGIKWSGSSELNLERLEETVAAIPQLAHFLGEGNLLKGMRFGIQGCYSAWVLAWPKRTIEIFELADQGNWEEAEALHHRCREASQFIVAMVEELGLGMMDPIIDKGFGVLCGFLTGHQRTRPPYIGWPDEAMQIMRQRVHERFPEFLWE